MVCPFRQELDTVISCDIEGTPLEIRKDYHCTLQEMAPCIGCTQIMISNRNTTSTVTFYRPDGRKEMIYGNY